MNLTPNQEVLHHRGNYLVRQRFTQGDIIRSSGAKFV